MKIGILTFHDGPNHGAFLQAWATYRTLAKAGHDVEIINYKNARHLQMETGRGLRRFKNPIFEWQNWQKRRAFRRSHRDFGLGPLITDAALLRQRRFQAVVIGSDVVWNYNIFGYDPVFFGRINTERRIAFSASFGTVRTNDQHPTEMGTDLAAFDAISVRDTNSREIIRQIINREVNVTLDPALIYNYAQDLPGLVNPKTSRVLLVYSFLQTSQAIEHARSYAKEHSLRIECIGYPPPIRAPRYCNQINMACGPFRFVEKFSSCHTILTSTFHGVVFSLKSQKPFFFVSSDKTHNRVSSLLDYCGINHELEIGMENRIHFFTPDYGTVTPILNSGGDASRKWLLEQVSCSC